MTTDGGAEAPAPWRAAVGRYVGMALSRSLYRCRIVHPERVPPVGPVLLVANHSAFLDGPLVFSSAPRPANFLVKAEAFHGFFGWLVASAGQIPIDRSLGDRTALSTAVAVLKRGGAVGVFPEGTRAGRDQTSEINEINRGAAWIALRTGAPVVPVAVLGTRVSEGSADSWPRLRSTLTVAFGEPFDVVPDLAVPGRERLRLATEQVRAALVSHVQHSRVENGSSH